MKKTALIILCVMVAIAATAKTHKHKKKTASANDPISITMHRTACFGRCPEYTITINKGGTILYTGIRFTTDSGSFKKSAGSAAVMPVFTKFSTYRVDTCGERYDSRMTDVPGIIYTIQYKSRTQTINEANFGPYFLRDLANTMDGIGKKADDNGWKKVAAPVNK